MHVILVNSFDNVINVKCDIFFKPFFFFFFELSCVQWSKCSYISKFESHRPDNISLSRSR